VLGFAYVLLTAKPISMRRLSTLFVVALILATLMLGALRVRDSRKDALLAATSVTLIVWITPLLHVLRDSIRRRQPSLDALRPVSIFVRLTYGFALAAAPIIAVSVAFKGTRGLHSPVLFLVIAGLIALALQPRITQSRLRRLDSQPGNKRSGVIGLMRSPPAKDLACFRRR
jgi:hypothetical protein